MEFSPPLADGSECATASSSTPTPWQCRTTLIQENRDTIPFPSTSLEHLPVNPPEEVAAPTRQRWSSPFEFLVTCVGYAVGLGNFWRFPYLCYKHGGGAFLVPYSIVLVVIGMPLFLLELGVGQKFQVGPLQAWRKIHPSLAGIGMTGVLVTFFVALYYNIIVAWTLWYLFHSFASPLPWAADQGGANTGLDQTVSELREAIQQAKVGETTATLRETADSFAKTADELGKETQPLTRDARRMLAALEEASQAMQKLSEELSRQPNSVIWGRKPEASPGLRR